MQFRNLKEIKAIKVLKPYLGYYPSWSVPALVTLGILSSFSEGIGISLFIPFLNSVNQTASLPHTGNWLLDSLGNLFNDIRPQSRLLIIALCIFISVLVKSLLSYGNSVLSTWLNMRASHRIRSAIFEKILTVSFRFLQVK